MKKVKVKRSKNIEKYSSKNNSKEDKTLKETYKGQTVLSKIPHKGLLKIRVELKVTNQMKVKQI